MENIEIQAKKKSKSSFLLKSFEQRNALFERQIYKHPDSAPIIMQLKEDNILVYEKISVPRKMTINEFRIKLNNVYSTTGKDKSSLLRIRNQNLFLNNSSIIKDIYDEYKQKDGWLYLSLLPLSFF